MCVTKLFVFYFCLFVFVLHMLRLIWTPSTKLTSRLRHVWTVFNKKVLRTTFRIRHNHAEATTFFMILTFRGVPYYFLFALSFSVCLGRFETGSAATKRCSFHAVDELISWTLTDRKRSRGNIENTAGRISCAVELEEKRWCCSLSFFVSVFYFFFLQEPMASFSSYFKVSRISQEQELGKIWGNNPCCKITMGR